MLKFLIEKECKQILRNSFLPKLILAMPLMMMLVYPWVANQEVKNVRVTVVDNDRSVFSERMARKITASGYFKPVGAPATYGEAMRDIESGEADLIIEIQDDFEKRLMNGETGHVMISVNSTNGTKGTLGSSYLSSILADYAAELRAEYGSRQTGLSVGTPSFDVVPQYKFNPHLDYKVFMVPALMVMLLTMMCGFLPALNIVGEKESGTIEQMNVTPVSKLMFVMAKLIPYWIIGFIVLNMCMGLGVLVYGIYPAGSLLTIYLFASIYILVVSGMGLVISNYSDTMLQAMFVMFFFMMILILMSGLFTPVAAMPEWAQVITMFNPLRYFIEVMRLVYLKGSSFAEMSGQFFVLCGFAAGLSLWAVRSYRKSS